MSGKVSPMMYVGLMVVTRWRFFPERCERTKLAKTRPDAMGSISIRVSDLRQKGPSPAFDQVTKRTSPGMSIPDSTRARSADWLAKLSLK